MFAFNTRLRTKYFIGISPPAEISQSIEEIKLELFREHRLKGALRSPAHITLHRPFEWKTDKEGELIEHLEKFHFQRKFRIQLRDFACFQPKVIYVNVLANQDLTDLYYLLSGYARRNMLLFNESEDERGFKPHVTVAFRDLKKQLFYKLWDTYSSKKFEAEFEYSGISLFRMENKWEIRKSFCI